MLSTRHPWSAAPPRAGLSLPHHPYFQLQRSTFTRKRTSSSPSSPSSSPSAFAGRSRGSRCSRARSRPFWCHPSPLVAWSCGAVTVGQLANVVGGDVGPAAAPEQMMRRRKRARGKQPWRLAIAGLWRRGRHDDRSTDTPPTSGYRECSRTSEAGAGGTGCECGEDGRWAGGMTSRVRVNTYREGGSIVLSVQPRIETAWCAEG